MGVRDCGGGVGSGWVGDVPGVGWWWCVGVSWCEVVGWLVVEEGGGGVVVMG